MDIWDGAEKMVKERMANIGFDTDTSKQLASGRRLTVTTTPPKRTDGGESATLVLSTPTGRIRERRHPSPRSQHGRLLTDIGVLCQGCERNYNFDPRVLEVDHIRPRSDGGSDAYDNLTLLCPPCNKEKRDRMTLTGLQAENRRQDTCDRKTSGTSATAGAEHRLRVDVGEDRAKIRNNLQ